MKRVLNHAAVVRRQNLRKPNYEACLSAQGIGLKDTRKSYEKMNATIIVLPMLRQIFGEILCCIFGVSLTFTLRIYIIKGRAEILQALHWQSLEVSLFARIRRAFIPPLTYKLFIVTGLGACHWNGSAALLRYRRGRGGWKITRCHSP
jgi:hypothetical protein